VQLNIPRVVRNWEYAPSIQPSIELHKYIKNGYGRRFISQDSAPYWSEAFAAFGLKPMYIEPKFQNMTANHFLDGAFTHVHKDHAPTGFVHTRCNVMLKKPLIGGNPILDGEHVEVGVNDMWLCLASLEEHASEPVQGGERIMFSFGGLVSTEQIERILA
jgi:hypothetical protein